MSSVRSIEVPRPAIPEALLASLRRALARAGTPRWTRRQKGKLEVLLRTEYVDDALSRRLVAVFDDQGAYADLAVQAVNALPRLLDELIFLRRLLSSLLASWSSSEFRNVDVIPAIDWVRAKLPKKQSPKKQQPLKQQPLKKLPPKKQQPSKKKVLELNAPRPGRGRKHGEGAGVVVAEKKRTRKAR